MGTWSTDQRIRTHALELTGNPKRDYKGLLDEVGDAEVVMIGESSHGTREFYEERAKLTKLLVEEKGFSLIVCEANWPDMARVNRYIRGLKGDSDADEALSGFRRFPSWTWRNHVMVDFVEWAKEYNSIVFDKNRSGKRLDGMHSIGMYGFDLYSVHASIQAVIEYLEKKDKPAAERVRQSCSCFDHFFDMHCYGRKTNDDTANVGNCEDDVIGMLVEVLKQAPDEVKASKHDRDAAIHEDEHFFALQNASVVRDAEEYFRAVYRDPDNGWGIRDKHMFNTLTAILDHCSKLIGHPCKTVVWAHNCHVGDARASEMSWRWQEVNFGQLVRERFSEKVFCVGFSTYQGTVTAARDWNMPAERMSLTTTKPGTWESVSHKVGYRRFLLVTRKHLSPECKRLKRSVGIIYKPDTERWSHYYFEAKLARHYDALIHIDETSGVEPLDKPDEDNDKVVREEGNPAETFPHGI